jgi:hypothetical protein
MMLVVKKFEQVGGQKDSEDLLTWLVRGSLLAIQDLRKIMRKRSQPCKDMGVAFQV